MKQREKKDKIFQERMAKKTDELRWLYMELYGNDSMFFELCDQLHRFYEERTVTLKALDRKREADPGWYKKNDMLGMMFYIDNFAGNMKGVESKLDYLEKNNVNYIHLSRSWIRRKAVLMAVMQWLISVKYRKIWELWMIWKNLQMPAIKKASVYVWIL